MSIRHSINWIVILVFLLVGAFPPLAFASTSTIVPGTVWNDTSGKFIQAHGGGIIKVGNTYYWFGENKEGFTNSGAFKGISCYSSTDLVNWTFVNLALSTQPSGDLGSDRIVERPKVIFNSNTNKYVMYMHIDDHTYSDARVGVATASSVTGPWTYIGSYRPLNHDIRDMTIYKDNDGTAYLMGAVDGNANFSIFQLSQDYLSTTSLLSSWSGVYQEAPAVVKQNGTYFILTSKQRGWTPTTQQYVSGTSMSGPWSSWNTIGNSDNYTSQSTFILPIQGTSGTTYLYMADRWNANNLQDSRYIWLPLVIQDNLISYGWFDQWNLDIAAGTFSVPSSYTNINTNAWYKIVNRNSGLVLDISGKSTADGGNLIQYTDNGGMNQHWRFIPIGNGYYQIVNRNSGKVLDVNTGSIVSGNSIIQYSNNGGANQQWSLQATGVDYFKMMNLQSLKPMDVTGSSKNAGAQIIQWDDLLQSNQQWSLVQVP